MKLILIFGPPAVGKMTVGHELEKITNLKLFHNHMTIELVDPFFSYNTKTGKKLVKLFRKEIFEEVANSDLEGLVFTFVWFLDDKKDWNYTKKISNIFKKKGGEVCFVELEADLEERIMRNKSPHRLEHKPTKRDVEFSEQKLKEAEDHRMNSQEGEIKEKNYIKINNTNLDPTTVALKIKEKFNL